MQAAGACSRADRAPIPPEVMPERGDTPVVISKRRANKAPKGDANVGVSGDEASRLRTGRHGAAGIQDLSPPRTGPEKPKGALSIWKASGGIEEGTSLADAVAKEGLTPVLGPNGCPEEFEGGRSVPSAAGEVAGPRSLRRSAGRNDLCLAQVDDQPDTIKTTGQ